MTKKAREKAQEPTTDHSEGWTADEFNDACTPVFEALQAVLCEGPAGRPGEVPFMVGVASLSELLGHGLVAHCHGDVEELENLCEAFRRGCLHLWRKHYAAEVLQ